MKRYSVSYIYNRGKDIDGDKAVSNDTVKFHYYGRTDNVNKEIAYYKKCLNVWVSHLGNENYEYRTLLDDYCGIRITDKDTKQIVFEEVHFAEEYGWIKKWQHKQGNGCSYWEGTFERK